MDVGTLVAHIRVRAEHADKTLDRIEKKSRRITDTLTTIGKISAFSSLAGGAVALTSALGPASGMLLALPAAAGLAGAAFATLKVGTKGVGDALKAFADGDAKKAAEAMAKLSPAARAFVTSANKVRESFKGIQQQVQDTLFRGLASEVDKLGATYLPILARGLTSNAAALNGWAMSAAAAARSPFVSGAVGSILDQTANIMMRNSSIGGNLVTTLVALAQAGMPLMNQFMNWASGSLASAAGFLSSAQGAAWLAQKVTAAQAVFTQFGMLLRNIGSLLASVFRAALPAGQGLLATLIQLTAQAAAWAKSAQGQAQLAGLFTLLTMVLQQLLPVLGFVSSAVLTLSGWFGMLPAPLQSIVAGFLSFALVAGLLVPKIIALVSGLISMGTALITAGSWVAGFAMKLGTLMMMAGRVTVFLVASTARMLAGWAVLAAGATMHAIRVGAAWLLTAGASAATAVATTVASLARIVAGWAMAAAGAMARAVMMAAAWFVALGPIGWVIAAVIGLVALIIANWDTVKSWTISAWNAVVGAITGAWNTIVSTVQSWIMQAVAFIMTGWAQAKAATTAAWNALKSAVSSGIAAVVGFVRSLPGKILSALSSLGSLLVGLGGDMVRGLWNGIQAGWSWLTGAVRNLASQLLSAAKSALGIGSPSKEFERGVGRWLPAGIAVGVEGNRKQAQRAVAGMSAGLTSQLADPRRRGTGAALAAAGPDPGAVGAAVRDALADLFNGGMTASFDPRGLVTMQRAADVRDVRRSGGLIARSR